MSRKESEVIIGRITADLYKLADAIEAEYGAYCVGVAGHARQR
jgi:hypothetical protein